MHKERDCKKITLFTEWPHQRDVLFVGPSFYVWKCNRRYDHAEKCKTLHLHEDVIVYAFNEAVQSMIKNNTELVEFYCRIVFSSIRAGKSVSKAERKQLITDYIPAFPTASPREIPFSETAWLIILEQVVIMRDRRMIIRFIDGSEYTYNIPNYSPMKKSTQVKQPANRK